MIAKSIKNSIPIILPTCFFSSPKMPYSANSLFLLFNQKFIAYCTNINVNIARITIPNFISVGKTTCLVLT